MNQVFLPHKNQLVALIKFFIVVLGHNHLLVVIMFHKSAQQHLTLFRSIINFASRRTRIENMF